MRETHRAKSVQETPGAALAILPSRPPRDRRGSCEHRFGQPQTHGSQPYICGVRQTNTGADPDEEELDAQADALADGSLDPDEVDPRVDPYDEGSDDE